MEIVKLTHCDTLIAGSTAAAMTAALEQAQKGAVLLVTEDTCLYAEMTESGDYRRPKNIEDAMTKLLFPEDLFETEDRYHPDRLKLHGEKVMKDHGVRLLYACHILGEQDGCVILAHKSGLFAAECKTALDFRAKAPAAEPVYCLHTDKDGTHFVNYISTPHTGNSAAAHFARYEEALEKLPAGHFPVRGGTALTDLTGTVLKKPEAAPVAKLPTGSHVPFCENPLYTNAQRCSVPGLQAHEDAWDVIVVGGGTAGASAALFCGRLGLRTLVLEMNRMLGGSATVGGVSAYWFGWREGATRIIDDRVEEYYQRLGHQREFYCWSTEDTFLPDLKAHALLSLCLEADVQVEFAATVCGVSKAENRITGVYWAQNGLLHYSAAGMVLDCTGDGDVCMFAGADHVYGNKDDGMTYWASLAQYESPRDYRNNFSTMVHVGDPLDYTRFILEGRTRGENTYDHGSYVAVRESRHIRGLKTITLEDILTMHPWEDTLYTCYSNYDPKGRLTAKLVYFGLLPPNQRVDIPRGAVIPVDLRGNALEGILVGGKAISCTHDAFPGLRMQPDLQRQGLALAALAGQSLRQKVPAAEAKDVDAVITALGGDLMRADIPAQPDPAELITALDGSEPWEWLDESITHWQTEPGTVTALLLAESEKVLPLLREAYAKANLPQLKLTLGRLLLWHGDETGISVILQAVNGALEETQGLPLRNGPVRFCELLPDHGVMPETVYLLNGLAKAQTVSLVPVFEDVLSRLERIDRNWQDLGSGIYCYCESFAIAAVGTGDKAFIPLIHRILTLPELNKKAALDTLEERFCMLRIALYAALHRLGDSRGRDGLTAFLSDSRRPLALAAEMLLEHGA